MSYKTQPIPVVADYVARHGGDPMPVVAQAFRPSRGWKTYPMRKRISRSWASKMRADGYTSVGLELDRDRIADFPLDELLSQGRAATRVIVTETSETFVATP